MNFGKSATAGAERNTAVGQDGPLRDGYPHGAGSEGTNMACRAEE